MMSLKKKRQAIISQNRGAIAIMVALLLGVLVSFSALSIDMGYGYITRTELQNIADGAALGGARQLGLAYEGMTAAEQQNTTLPSTAQQAITNMVQQVGQNNEAGGQAITINDGDIEIGKWDFSARTFTPGLVSPNAVRVTARRDGVANGPVATFLAGIMGFNTLNVSANATAALGALSTTVEGEIEAPVGISEYWFQQKGDFCGEQIRFHPTGDLDGCAGWHTFEESPASASQLKNVIDGLGDGSYESPATTAGQTSFEYIGGDAAAAFDNFLQLYNTRRVEEPPDNEWPTTIAVYAWDDCSNPHGDIIVSGYAKAVITEVIPPPDKTIMARIECNQYDSGRSTGSNFGLMGTIPGLVQ